ncbi:hypothetical protein [Brachybacterium tyrofermentans]|uniref:hypothetical protein n=1 Tax=Brachybacterium tyrofermentans TaxID=47848 RepID=UPI00186910BF|nr:hypothetical protein [Brachybacterium tyrofermentans]
MDDYRTYSDDELDESRRAVITEQERRVNLAAIPEQIEALAKVYRDGGGDEQALTDALTQEQIAAMSADA